MIPLLSRVWFTVAAVLVACNLVLLVLHLSTVNGLGHGAPPATGLSYSFTATGNVVSHSMESVFSAAGQSLNLAARSLRSGVGTAVQTVGLGFVAVIQTPGRLVTSVTELPGLKSFITPADHTPVAVIAPPDIKLASDVRLAASTAAVPNQASAPLSAYDQTPQWPIHGAVTLPFGVPEWPYAPWHTGIDISDGRSAGVTPIHPFRPGRVIEAAHFATGYGIHVIIDNGGGITSVYGHMSSLAVSVGQTVDKNTVLGYEGRTGTATGVHLHFEIRQNGRPVNPTSYVPGRP